MRMTSNRVRLCIASAVDQGQSFPAFVAGNLLNVMPRSPLKLVQSSRPTSRVVHVTPGFPVGCAFPWGRWSASAGAPVAPQHRLRSALPVGWLHFWSQPRGSAPRWGVPCGIVTESQCHVRGHGMGGTCSFPWSYDRPAASPAEGPSSWLHRVEPMEPVACRGRRGAHAALPAPNFFARAAPQLQRKCGSLSRPRPSFDL